MGVPPPPSVTIPQFEVPEILRLLKENKELMISTDLKKDNDVGATKVKRTQLWPPSTDQIKNICWPESKSCCYYDVQFNHGKVSEDFETLCQKLRERFVGCETTSSCTVWFSQDTSNKINSMTNKRKNSGRSPGRRLSHLARRRQTFSSANLLNNGTKPLSSSLPSTASERRVLMVEVKKNGRRQKSKNVRLQKEVPSAIVTRIQQTKRALFKSPPNVQRRISSASKSRSGSKKDRSTVDRNKIQNFKRALWPSESSESNKSRTRHERVLTNISGHINVNEKRKREDSDAIMHSNKCSRKLFSDSPKRKSNLTNDKSCRSNDNGENGLQALNRNHSAHKNSSAGLNERHKKKLLWAIAEALRGEGIGMRHESFRPCAGMLGYLVRSLLPDLNSKREGSTSDLMLKLSKTHVKDIIKKHKVAESNKVSKI
ncbi:hypothetical protein L9F63_021565 [Diploptera punctata]|uniref:Uncharacterized protein n=1 Tax=Diploptera punctata TaxID=6984 RepID=A0AAD7ZQN6_DIPPU|nr:hypothetical protein L9F63_021565 [Diploptera punctata]